MSEIKNRMYRDKIASELFNYKSGFILNNSYLEYERISKEDFFEIIFGSDRNVNSSGEVLPFEKEQCSEYVDWREQAYEKGYKNIVYHPEQNFKYNAILLGIYRGVKRGPNEEIIKECQISKSNQ